MKTFNSTDYPSLLKTIQKTAEAIVTDIRKYKLTFLQNRDQQVEWEMSIPMFVPSFYDFIQNTSNIPQQLEFWNHYRNLNTNWFNNTNLSAAHLDALKARAYRTYPSLVRDIHFAKYAETNFSVADIIYNQKLDIEEGIDLMILHNGNNYAINLYTDTNRAFQGRLKKTFRHTNFSNVKYLEVPVDFKGSVQCGDFFLYGERELQKIKASIGIDG